jgi:nicotinate-nucleotide adenylyltransferase
MRVGLYFGTFNPIHIGHLAIANYMLEYSDLDQIWFVVTPRSPFKVKKSLLNDYHRLDLVNKAIAKYPNFRASDIEFHLDQPNYTSRTLVELSEKFPEYNFSIIMGQDNLANLHKWKNYQYIIDNHAIFVYPRPNIEKELQFTAANVTVVNAPLMEVSSTMIREGIKEGKNLRAFLPEGLWDYIDTENFYK